MATAAPPDHIVADSAELAKARDVLAAFERSQMTGGTDGEARAAVLGIARAGSLPEAPAWAEVRARVQCPRHEGHLVAGGHRHAEGVVLAGGRGGVRRHARRPRPRRADVTLHSVLGVDPDARI